MNKEKKQKNPLKRGSKWIIGAGIFLLLESLWNTFKIPVKAGLILLSLLLIGIGISLFYTAKKEEKEKENGI